MINISKLNNLLNLEISTNNWWDALNTKEKLAYINSHPNSKYAKQNATPKIIRKAVTPPKIIHHLTPRENIPNIRKTGLKPSKDGLLYMIHSRFPTGICKAKGYRDLHNIGINTKHPSLKNHTFKYHSWLNFHEYTTDKPIPPEALLFK